MGVNYYFKDIQNINTDQELAQARQAAQDNIDRLNEKVASLRSQGVKKRYITGSTIEIGNEQKRLVAIRDRQKTLNRSAAQNITVRESERIEQLAKQEGIKEFGTPAQRFQREFNEATRQPAPRNMADDDIRRFRAAGVASPVRVAPPRTELPISVPRVYDEATGLEVNPSMAGLGGAGTFRVTGGAASVVGSPTTTGFIPSLTTKKEDSNKQYRTTQTYGAVTSFKNNRFIPDFIEKPVKQFLSTFLNPTTQSFQDARNPEIGSTAETLGLVGGTVSRIWLAGANPSSGNLNILSTGKGVGTIIKNPFLSAVPTAVVSGATNRFLIQQPATALTGNEKVGLFSGAIAEGIGYGVAGEGFARASAAKYATVPFIANTIGKGSKGAVLTLSLLSSGPAGAIEGALEETSSQLRGAPFSPKKIAREAMGGASSSVLLGALYQTGSLGKWLVTGVDPTEPVSDALTTGLKTFGTENIAVRTPTAAIPMAFAGFSSIGLGSSSVISSAPSVSRPFGKTGLTVFDTGRGAKTSNQLATETKSFLTSPVAVKTNSKSITARSLLRSSSRSQIRSFSPVATNTPSNTNSPLISITTPVDSNTNIFSGVPVASSVPVVTRVTARATSKTNVPINSLTPMLRFPPLFFPGSPGRASSKGLLGGFSRPRGTRYVPGLASITLGIYGKPSQTGLFSGAEARPLIDFSAPKKKKAKKGKKKAAKKVSRRKK